MRTLFLFLSFALLATAQSTTTGAAVFSGSGLNDATSGGRFTALPTNATYLVTISATGTTDHFTWTLDDGTPSAPVAITGAAQTLSNGITITFAATTGHTLADSWSIFVSATSSSSGVNYINGGNAAAMRSSQSKLRDIASVKDYGALGNGSDATTAFQNALNVVAGFGVYGGTVTNSGARVDVPAGRYVVGPINVPRGVHIHCETMGEGAKLLMKTNGEAMFTVPGSSLGGISDCFIDSNGKTGTVGILSQSGAGSSISTHNIFSNITMNGLDTCVTTSNSYFNHFENISCTQPTSRGFLFAINSNSTTCTDCKVIVGANPITCFQVSQSINVTIAGATAEGNCANVTYGTNALNINGFYQEAGAVESTTTFVGTGLNDAITCGSRTAGGTITATISATGTPDSFTWTSSSGASGGPTAITGGCQLLTAGVGIKFTATTGHTIADAWTLYTPSDFCIQIGIGDPFQSDGTTITGSTFSGCFYAFGFENFRGFMGGGNDFRNHIGAHFIINNGPVFPAAGNLAKLGFDPGTNNYNFNGAGYDATNAVLYNVDPTVEGTLNSNTNQDQVVPLLFTLAGGATPFTEPPDDSIGNKQAALYWNGTALWAKIRDGSGNLWYSEVTSIAGVQTIGPPGTGGGLVVNTPGFAPGLPSSFTVSGTFASLLSTVILDAIGTASGGGYSSNFLLRTYTGATNTGTLLMDSSGGLTPSNLASGGTQCLQATSAGLIQGSGAACAAAGTGFTGNKTRTECSTIMAGVPSGCSNVTETYVNGLLQ